MSWIRTSVLALLLGCASAPPSGWQQGGAPLFPPRARWVNGDLAVDLDARGRVLIGGEHVMTIDRAGRAFDPYGDPIALLRKDGMVYGPDDEPLGWVGMGKAILPGEGERWLEVAPNGEVARFDHGDVRPFGVWLGCGHAASVQTCTMVTHLVGMQLRERERAAEPSVSIGIGVGVGVP